ncbi:MAG: GlxA family transcriptional regulator [Nitratireductor sp.]|nr:GlxA family transcriptional regulator [Nitratireductor sp.]
MDENKTQPALPASPTGQKAAPMEITILVLPESSMLSLASTIEPLRACNRVSRQELVRWRIVTIDGGPVMMTCGLPIASHGRIDDDLSGELLIIVSAFNHASHAGSRAIAQLKKLSRRFKIIAGVEAGSWVLARMGLLEGRAATTHWEDFEDFAQAFPETELKTQRFVTDGNVMTAGGASPTLDMMLHLIRSRFGHRIALEVASVFIYDEAHAASDVQPAVSLGRIAAMEPRVAEAIRLMERAIDRPLSTSVIARRAGVSVRTLETLFRKTIGESPAAYFSKLRLQTARRLVIDTDLAMREIAIRTGFGSLSAFSRAFASHAGAPAMEIRRNARLANSRE